MWKKVKRILSCMLALILLLSLIDGQQFFVRAESEVKATQTFNRGNIRYRRASHRDVYSYIAWKNQDVVFVNERLESIMEKIERWYDVSVFFQNDSLKDVRFYGNVERYADIRDLLFFLEKTSDVRFSVKDRTIIVSNK